MSSCRAEINFGHLGIWNAGKNLDTGATALQHNALATLAGRYIAFCPYNVAVCQNFVGQAGNTQDALKGKADSLNSLLLRRLRTGPQNLENRCTCFFPLLFSDALCMYCYCKTKGEVLRKKLSRKAAIGNCHTDGFRAPAAAAPASSGLLAVGAFTCPRSTALHGFLQVSQHSASSCPDPYQLNGSSKHATTLPSLQNYRPQFPVQNNAYQQILGQCCGCWQREGC